MPCRIFTEAFKKEAVRLFKEQDLTLAEVSRNLDIDPKSLKSWVTLYDAGALKSSLGAINLLAAGHAVLACGVTVQQGRTVKHEPAEVIRKSTREPVGIPAL